MTTAIRYPAENLLAGADGLVPFNPIYQTNICCQELPCADAVDTYCTFLSNMPSGPLWDRDAEEVRDALTRAAAAGHNLTHWPTLQPYLADLCPSMARYALFVAVALQNWINTGLRPAVLESQFFTARDTLDHWLDRLGWQDCYQQNCSEIYRPTTISPYSIIGDCGEVICAPEFEPEFAIALKYGIVRSLQRLRRGVINNLDGINWVIAPLNSQLVVDDTTYDDRVLEFIQAGSNCRPEGPEDDYPCFSALATFRLENIGDTMDAGPSDADRCDDLGTIAALQTFKRQGIVVELYPALLAAECIVRSMFTRNCPNIINLAEIC